MACGDTPIRFASSAGPPAALMACTKAMSLFLGTEGLKHYFHSDVKHCLRRVAPAQNQVMLDSTEIGRRLKKAMDEAEPPVSGSDLAAACRVSPQAVSGWRRTGRFSKRHLPTISRLTGKPVEFFVTENVHVRASQGIPTRPWIFEKVVDEDLFLVVFRTWQDARSTDRENLVAIAKTARKAHGTRRRKRTV